MKVPNRSKAEKKHAGDVNRGLKCLFGTTVSPPLSAGGALMIVSPHRE